MTRACHTSVRMATGEAFSDAEIDDMLDRLARRHRRLKGQRADADTRAAWEDATRELTREELAGALIQRRLEAAAALARDVRRPRMDALPGDEGDKLRAYNVGTERQGPFSGASVDAEGRARGVSLWGDVERGLRQADVMDRLADFLGRGDPAFERRVAREMARLNGWAGEATGDEAAVAAAKVFAAGLERSRLMQNAEGAWIGRLEGYIARQGHDRLKVSGGFWRELQAAGLRAVTDWQGARLSAARKAFREWRDFIGPKLHEMTFEGLDPEDVALQADAAELASRGVIDDPQDLRERFLFHVWFDIVTGANERLGGAADVGEFRPPPSKARAVSKARVLHFNDPEAWMDYHDRFGRGSLFSVIMGQMERAGRNAALMARWGPAPEAAFANEVDRLAGAARARGDAGAAVKVGSRMRRAEFDELTGETNRPDNLRLAIVGRTIRTSQVLSKLGGMVLSALSDTSLASQALARTGVSFLDGYRGAWSGIARLQGEEGRRAADLVDVGARSAAAHLSGRFVGSDGPLGWSAWAQRLFYRVNGFEAWNDGLRRGVAEMLAAHLGEQAGKDWAGLEIGTRETLERFGVDPVGWNLVRKGVTTAEDGRAYLTFDAVDAASELELAKWAGLNAKQATPEALSRAREDLRLRLQTLVSNVLDDATTEARAREKVALTRGLKSGTILGEAVRTFTQFWSFSAALFGRHMVPSMRGFAGRPPAALMAHLIVATTLMGAASMEAKQLAKGRTARPLDDPNAWIAAMLQGGGLGIYGDFLFGDYNRNDQSVGLSAFAGPAVAETERLLQIVRMATHGDVQDMPAELLRLGTSNAPFINIWYTRLALDYLVLWRLQEAVSPGYLDRYEQRVRENQHTDFLVKPTAVLG